MTTAPQRTFWQRNGLSLVLVAVFALFLGGQIVAGRTVLNQERAEQGRAPVGWFDYLHEGHFLSATFENWESEFFQMGAYVLLTVYLRQKGSAESRSFKPEPPRIEEGPTPALAKRRGIARKLYEHSLALALFALFIISFGMHWLGSWRQYTDEQLQRGEAPMPAWEYLGEARFWFESFQNWQSEFLAVLALVVLSIWLRQKDSPQSKPVKAPHSQTGT